MSWWLRLSNRQNLGTNTFNSAPVTVILSVAFGYPWWVFTKTQVLFTKHTSLSPHHKGRVIERTEPKDLKFIPGGSVITWEARIFDRTCYWFSSLHHNLGLFVAVRRVPLARRLLVHRGRTLNVLPFATGHFTLHHEIRRLWHSEPECFVCIRMGNKFGSSMPVLPYYLPRLFAWYASELRL